MPPGHADLEGQPLLADLRGAGGQIGQQRIVERVHVGGGIDAEGDDISGEGAGVADEAVAVRAAVGDDRGATFLQPSEDLALGVGDGFLAAEEFDVSGGDRRDDRDVGADLRGQSVELAGVVHTHLEHPRSATRRASAPG